MGIILIIIIAFAVIYFIRKGSSGQTAPVEKPAAPQIRFDELSPEAQAVRSELFDASMQGENGAELTRCYHKVKSLFIPKKNGEFAGSLSGLLSEKSRAKTLAAVDVVVRGLLGCDPQAYAAWYDTLFDNLLGEMYTSSNGKLARSTQAVLADVQQGDELLEQTGVVAKLADPAYANCSTKIKTQSATVRIETKTRDGEFRYYIKGAYQSFKYGLCLDDPLIRKAEILITICAKYEYGPKYELQKDDVEKYALPGLRNFNNDSCL